MKKIFALAAVLCCAMSMTMFTACGDDETPEPKTPEQQDPQQQDPQATPDSTKAVYVRVMVKFHNTEDMLKYLDQKVMFQLNDDEVQSFGMATPATVDSVLKYDAISNIEKYPVTMKFFREVTVKEEFKDTVAAMKDFEITNRIEYFYAYFNADKKLIDGRGTKEPIGSYGTPEGAKLLEEKFNLFNDIYTFTFDETGYMHFSHPKKR